MTLSETDSEFLNFERLLESGVVEFLDVEEEETCMIAMYIKDLCAT